MNNVVVFALRDAGFTLGTVIVRNERTGRALADLAGRSWQGETGATTVDLLVNATSIGMTSAEHVKERVFDDDKITAGLVVALQWQMPLIPAREPSSLACVRPPANDTGLGDLPGAYGRRAVAPSAPVSLAMTSLVTAYDLESHVVYLGRRSVCRRHSVDRL